MELYPDLYFRFGFDKVYVKFVIEFLFAHRNIGGLHYFNLRIRDRKGTIVMQINIKFMTYKCVDHRENRDDIPPCFHRFNL